ncbi:VOC family protein [Streptosporangium sp. NPDC005286]|uniref:VOC family protein n=1 Tax=Streptosporangium sp. NPDC005286 TaxID=3154463 RepID=UPI0033A06B6B
MSDVVIFDHLAIGVESWEDAYPRFAVRLGGAWSHGGDTGEFAPYQLVYAHDMRLEFIAPGARPGGFMRRFIDRNGPSPHHLTFQVPSLVDALDRLRAIGIDTLGGRNETYWKEAFLHPKQAGMGTLIQLAEADKDLVGGFASPAPEGFPESAGKPLGISWVGLTVASLDTAGTLFADQLSGHVRHGGRGWFLVSWGTGHNLLVRERAETPGGAGLWLAHGLGVDHVMFGSPELTPGDLEDGSTQAVRMPYEPSTGVAVLQAWQDVDRQ